jgi:NitT/TauT family transport system permease protein
MKKRDVIPPILLGIIFIVLWEGICDIFKIKTFLLPKPTLIIKDIYENILVLIKNAGITFIEAFIGFIIANGIAIILSISMIYIRYSEKAIMPFAIALKTTPIVALAPLLLLWLGNGLAPKIASAALICFFPVLVNTIKGFYSLHEGEEDLFFVYGASKTKMLFKLRFQRAAPYVFSALKVSSSLSIVGAIVGEFVGANIGIGYLILVSSYHLETVRMFSALIISATIGVIFYTIISYADRKIVFWDISPEIEIRIPSPRIYKYRIGK